MIELRKIKKDTKTIEKRINDMEVRGILIDFENFDIDQCTQNIFVNDFNDEYHREKSDEEKSVMGMRTQYDDVEEFYDAKDKYNNYIASIKDTDDVASAVNTISLISAADALLLSGKYDLLVPNAPVYIGNKDAKREYDTTGNTNVIYGATKGNDRARDVRKDIYLTRAMMVAFENNKDSSSVPEGFGDNVNITDAPSPLPIDLLSVKNKKNAFSPDNYTPDADGIKSDKWEAIHSIANSEINIGETDSVKFNVLSSKAVPAEGLNSAEEDFKIYALAKGMFNALD